MAIDFPNSPAVNDTHTVGTTTWKWDGTSWNLVPTTAGSVEGVFPDFLLSGM